MSALERRSRILPCLDFFNFSLKLSFSTAELTDQEAEQHLRINFFGFWDVGVIKREGKNPRDIRNSDSSRKGDEMNTNCHGFENVPFPKSARMKSRFKLLEDRSQSWSLIFSLRDEYRERESSHGDFSLFV